MTLDLEAIKDLTTRAASPQYCDDCGLLIATQDDFDTPKEGEGEDLCWRDFSDCGVVFGISAEWRASYARDVPALVAEVERLREYLFAILRHGATVWADSSCGSGGAGGQMITTTTHGEVVQHLANSALHGKTLSEAADDYEAWVPGTSRLDEAPRRPRRAGPDGRPV